MRAILSVSDKNGLVELARGLTSLGIELISTGGTAKAIAAVGLPVVNVSDVTGFPEMMDGRVKTLHPAMFAGILARRHRADDLAALAAQGIKPIDIVVVNLYPFGKAADNPDTSFDGLVEEIDIGGPSLLRAAAKNFRDVLVVVHPEDYPRVLQELARDGGPSLQFRFDLMKRAFMHTGRYDGMIAMTMAHVDASDGAMTRRPLKRPTSAPHGGPRPLRYGENPHQTASWIQFPPESGRTWQVHQGKELSYTNLLDLDAALRIALEFTEPAAVVIKHTNPCGVATGATIDEAYVRARNADAKSAFGGIVGVTGAIDAATARALTSTFIEAVIAPSVDEDALAVLAAKQNMRVVTTDFSKAYEPIAGRDPVESLVVPGRSTPAAVRPSSGGGRDLALERVSEGGHQTSAHGRRMDGAPLCVARLCAREIECGHFHRRGSHRRNWRWSDEPCGCREGGGDESGGLARRGVSPHRTPSSRSATAWMQSLRLARPRSCSRADRCATGK